MLKNTRFLDALAGKDMERPPVWMMRQAGRYLPEFRALRDKFDFFTRCQTPELAAEITLMPLKRFPLDAAILFSDILVVPQAMGLPFQMKEQTGPFLEHHIQTIQDIEKLSVENVPEVLHYVYQAIEITLEMLSDEVPLIGFAGSPWTIFCYAVEGKGSKTFDKAKAFCFKHPEWAHILLQKITDATILYLKGKIKAGVHAVQIFDSWGGVLSPKDYEVYSWKYATQIINALEEEVPVIFFAKGCGFALELFKESKATAIGLDWTIDPKVARDKIPSKTLQGNFDPAKLLGTPEFIRQEVSEMIRLFGTNRYIANLGHGILPNVPLENVQAFVESVVRFRN